VFGNLSFLDDLSSENVKELLPSLWDKIIQLIEADYHFTKAKVLKVFTEEI